MIIGIKATVIYEKKFWSVIFERFDGKKLSLAKTVFGKEPTDPEIYQYLLENFNQLSFSNPSELSLVIKRKNPKRIQREIKKEMNQLKDTTKKETYAQEMMRKELEKKKQIKKNENKKIKDEKKELRFQQKVKKKKEKHKGH